MNEQNNMINHISALIIGAREMANTISELESLYGGDGTSDPIVNATLCAASRLEHMITKPVEDGPHSECEDIMMVDEHLCRDKKVCGD